MARTMSSLAQRVYWLSPPAVKNWLASLQARRSDRWRHGASYDRTCAEIAEHDQWSHEQLADYQRRRLVEVVQLAGKHVPYYRKTFAETGVDVSTFRGPEDLSQLPILEKQPVRAHPTALLDERLHCRKLLVTHTSGTTGTPLDIYHDEALMSAAYAYFDSRCREVAGLARRRNRSVSIGVSQVASPNRTRPPFWVYNARWNQLYMSCYHLAPKFLDSYVAALRKFRGEYFEGYPSSVYTVARHIVDNNLPPVPFVACFPTAETLFDFHRETIAKAFGCRVYNQYGCSEMVVFAGECEHGSMHLSPEIGYVEVVDKQDRPVPVGQVGQLICTSVINHVQPFIRYRLGDVGALSDKRCPCGRPLPVLDRIEGRIDTVLITRDGRRIGRLDPVFKGGRGIAEAQIVQNDYGRFVVRIVPGKDYTSADGATIVRNLGERVGEAEIRIELVDQIGRAHV